MGASMGKTGGNFFDALPSQGTLHIVMLGLDSAGKTTALYRLKFDQYLNTVPTIGFNCEKVQGSVGKAKGVTFLVWDVGGQEKLRPLWRSYTRCTDGILFVVDSVDVERMEEAKLELMRTAKCPDNQGVPVLILANKQDLPGARDTKELEKLLGLHELIYPNVNITSSMMSSCTSSSTGNIVSCSGNNSANNSYGRSLTPTSQPQRSFGYGVSVSSCSITKELGMEYPTTTTTTTTTSSTIRTYDSATLLHEQCNDNSDLVADVHPQKKQQQQRAFDMNSAANSTPTAATTTTNTKSTESKCASLKKKSNQLPITTNSAHSQQFKGWYIQPTCAITGEGLQEGLEALYEMIIKRRKMNKAHRKKR